MHNIATTFTTKDLETDQEVRWCPGCGDYAILSSVQKVLPQLGKPKNEFVFVSGIGCSSRFPYYMNTYGMHSIHGRATSIATGIKVSKPNLSVWVITGDGDSLSIGGNHLIHTLRRNVDLNILLFNNQIYGLTKGQYSPTSELGKVTKSSPKGSADMPFNPLALALGAGGTFIARTIDKDPKHQQEIYKRAYFHKGTSLVEIYQNCNVFNDGAFEILTNKETKSIKTIYVENNKPLIFDNEKLGIRLNGLQPEVVPLDNYSANDLFIHDETDKTKAFILSQFFENESFPRPFGVLYSQPNHKTFDELMNKQLVSSSDLRKEFEEILKTKNFWTIG